MCRWVLSFLVVEFWFFLGCGICPNGLWDSEISRRGLCCEFLFFFFENVVLKPYQASFVNSTGFVIFLQFTGSSPGCF
jgi:hypothetical protein